MKYENNVYIVNNELNEVIVCKIHNCEKQLNELSIEEKEYIENECNFKINDIVYMNYFKIWTPNKENDIETEKEFFYSKNINEEQYIKVKNKISKITYSDVIKYCNDVVKYYKKEKIKKIKYTYDKDNKLKEIQV